MSINALLTLVEQYKEAAQLIEAAQAEQEQLKIQIREALAERSTNYLEVGCHKIRLSDFSSTRLDSKAIKAVAPDLYDLKRAPYSAHRPKFALYRAQHTRRGGLHQYYTCPGLFYQEERFEKS